MKKKKILFITNNNVNYVSDGVLCGLYQINNIEVFLSYGKDYLFDDFETEFSKLYGRGFTYSRNIPSDLRKVHSSTEIKKNIKNGFYNAIFIQDPYLNISSLIYFLLHKQHLIVIDGTDYQFSKMKLSEYKYFVYEILSNIFRLKLSYTSKFRMLFPVLEKLNHSKKIYFYKRELLENQDAHPIGISINKKKITNYNCSKEILLAHLIPGVQETYIYKSEDDYYNSYKKSHFGLTVKKGGWDCLRHLEILANDCIPYFPDIENCPESTMTFFQKL